MLEDGDAPLEALRSPEADTVGDTEMVREAETLKTTVRLTAELGVTEGEPDSVGVAKDVKEGV